MNTLRELLDSAMFVDHADRTRIENFIYGEEKECDCVGILSDLPLPWGQGPHPVCHGTGKTRGPGLVERCTPRLEARSSGPLFYKALGADAALDLLRQELGEVT